MIIPPRTPAELALERALDYLDGSGIIINDDVLLAALALIEEGVREGRHPLLPWVMQSLPRRFGIEQAPLPMPCPPLSRASIGYDG
jgi:hypothetical protein